MKANKNYLAEHSDEISQKFRAFGDAIDRLHQAVCGQTIRECKMVVKELMISDWVYEGTSHPIRIRQNYGTSIRYDEDDYSHEVEESCLSPIPLTAEILEKNGFAVKSMIARIWSDYIIEYEFRANTISITNGINTLFLKVTNVHELQRALRCCGLSGVADNFKV